MSNHKNPNTHNPDNIIFIYSRVFIGYIICFGGLVLLFTLVIGWISGGSIVFYAPLLKGPDGAFPIENWTYLLGTVAISSLFSALEVKNMGSGWLFYGVLLLARLFFWKNAALWNTFPQVIRGLYDYVLIVHPIIYVLFGGKYAERMTMTPAQQREAAERDKMAQFSGFLCEYESLGTYDKKKLRDQGVYSAQDYATRKSKNLWR